MHGRGAGRRRGGPRAILAGSAALIVVLLAWTRWMQPSAPGAASSAGPRLVVDGDLIDLGTLPYGKRVTAEFQLAFFC